MENGGNGSDQCGSVEKDDEIMYFEDKMLIQEKRFADDLRQGKGNNPKGK